MNWRNLNRSSLNLEWRKRYLQSMDLKERDKKGGGESGRRKAEISNSHHWMKPRLFFVSQVVYKNIWMVYSNERETLCNWRRRRSERGAEISGSRRKGDDALWRKKQHDLSPGVFFSTTFFLIFLGSSKDSDSVVQKRGELSCSLHSTTFLGIQCFSKEKG